MAGGARRLVVVGHGMVGHRLVEALVGSGDVGAGGAAWEIVVFGDEPVAAYDRVHLSALFDGATPAELELVGPDVASHPAVEIVVGERVVEVDRDRRRVRTDGGRSQDYDVLVLATGSDPNVPQVPGRDRPGCFVYRTLADVAAIRSWAAGARRGVVVGGGLLGLEAAHALRRCGVATDVVEVAPRLMPVQVDADGGEVLGRRIAALGVGVRTSTTVAAIHGATGGDGHGDGRGRVVAVDLLPVGVAPAGAGTLDGATPDRLACDMVVFAAGIRPSAGLGRACGLAVGGRGGIVVDRQCRTSDPAIFAVGECAEADGEVYGLVSPGYQMARVVADTLRGRDAVFAGADRSARLKLLGVEVASFGDAHGLTAGADTLTWTDHRRLVHRRVVVADDGRLLGGVLVGDADGFDVMAQMARGEMATPADPAGLVAPYAGAPAAVGVGALPGTATVCSCENVTKATISAAVAGLLDGPGPADLAGVRAATRAGSGCGGCVPQLADLVRHELTGAGAEVDDRLCEHFAFTRRQLSDLVRVERITTFAALLAGHGTGRGCEICKPAVASILAATEGHHVLDDGAAALQDTNDHFLANLQRDGTYSVVPRVPGGEITPERLIVLGEVARDFGLATKITGGQRIDLLGARVEQLPPIWARLVAAGFESGHAYGKAVRTVKSCVGTNWCRYGVGDSTALAIALELRYRGLRAPHKIKLGVSGCTRECAEAQAKDVGLIATERGWNLYVCGNGGTRPRHAELLAEDLDEATVVRTVDRFLLYYIRTADRLQRTAPWLEHLDGGIDHLRRVVVDDALGLGAGLDADMARHVASYACEWRATLEDPERLDLFRTFVNTDRPDPDIVFVDERGQPRPARVWERVELRARRGETTPSTGPTR
jgi:nitrite reductase (NADH) large subunit